MVKLDQKVYKKLAQRLDMIPNGFPETESGVELKLLAKISKRANVETRFGLESRSKGGRASVINTVNKKPVFVLEIHGKYIF